MSQKPKALVLPAAGETKMQSGQATETSYDALMLPSDQQLPILPASGISLLNCLECLPGMQNFLASHGISARVVRGRITAQRSTDSSTRQMSVIIHPYSEVILDEFYENIKVRPSDTEKINVVELPRGVIINFLGGENDGPLISFPQSTMMTKDDVFFSADNGPLNEFGLFYVALYIVGNYARYYPDKWMNDIDNATPLALAVEELMVQAGRRLPLLTLSELMRNYYIPELR